MADKTTKVLEVIVDNNKAIASIAEYNQLIDDQKAKQKALAEEYKAGNISQVDYQRALAKSKEEVKAYSRSMQELSKEVQNNIKDGQEQEGSLRGLRAQLSNLTKEFDALSRAERNGEAGRAKMEEINRITNELKEAEEETQRFYRNVGNYPDVQPLETQLGELKKALAQLKYEGKDNTEEFAAMAQQAANMKDAIADVEQQITSTASDTKNLDTAVQGLSVAMSGMMLFGNIFEEGSEEAKKFNEIMMDLQKIMMVLNTLRAIQNATQKQGLLAQSVENIRLKAGNALKAIQAKVTTQATGATVAQTAAQKVLNAVMKASPVMWLVGGISALVGAYALFSDSSDETTDDLEEQQKSMEALTKAVERQREVLDKYVETLQAVGASDAEQLYARLQRIYDLMISAKWGDDKTALSKLFNEANNEALQFVQTWQALGEKMENQKGWSEARKELEAAKVEMESQLALIQRFHQQAIPGYAAADYTAAINYVESVYDEVLAKYQEKQQAAALAAAKAETDLLRKVTDERIALIEDENERTIETEEVRHARALDELETRLETEKDLTAKQRAAINNLIELEEQKHQQKMAEIDAKAQEEKRKADEEATKARIAAANAEINAVAEAIKLDWENKINEAINQGKDSLGLEVEAAKARMDALHQLEGESDAEFKARQLQAEREYIDAKKALNDYEVEMEQAKYDAIGGMVNGLTSILDAFGEDNKAFAKASKVLALGEIAINTGKALAAGIASAAAAGPFPANLAAIATTITTVLTNIASAISTVKSAKFATGGLVSGPGTGTSDSIPAMLSNGESVMNARSTAMFSPLLSAMNQAGGGVAFNPAAGSREGFEFLAAAVASGMKSADIKVAVDEVSRVNDRVATIKERSRL